MLNNALLDQVDQRIAQERGLPLPTQPVEQPQVPVQQPTDEPAIGTGGITGLTNSLMSGVVEAGFQTKDFFLGEPAQEDKSWFRQQHEALTGQLDQNPVNAIVQDISQFGTGLVGAGKLMGPIKVLQNLKNSGTVGRGAFEVARGAAAGFLALDPHEERLSNLVQDYEFLRNPVTEYLAADDDDSAIEGRFKNALEGIGMDLALVGIFEGSLRVIKALRRGDEAGAEAAMREVEELQAQRDADQSAMEAIEGRQVQDGPGSAPRVDAEIPEGIPQITVRAGNGMADGVDVPTGTRNVADVEIEPVRSEASAVPLRPQDQRYEPTVKLSDMDVTGIIQGVEADVQAISRFGSREAAQRAGHNFSRANLPWQKINSTEDVEALIANTARTLRTQMDLAKGGSVLTDARVSQMVSESAELFGQDPEVILGEIAKSGERATQMVADMEAAYIISRQLFEGAHELSNKIMAGSLSEFGGDAAAASKELTKRFTAAADMMAQGASIRAASGRALRRNRREFAITPDDVAKFKDIPPEKLAQILSSTGGDLRKLRETANPGFWRRVLDEGTFLLTNNLLWNWTTHAVNTSTNLYMLVARPVEKMLGSMLQGSRGSAVRRQAMQEFAYTAYSVSDAWKGMVDAFLKADSVMAPHQTEYFQTGSRVQQPEIGLRPIKDTWDLFYNGLVAANYRQAGQAAGKAAGSTYRTAVGMPTRALGSVDEFIKQLRYRSVVQARASVEGTDAGLKGLDLHKHIEKRLSESFTPDGRAIDDSALREAQITTFQQELISGTMGKAVQNFRHNWPATAFVLPFVKTPINVLRYATKMTPGLNLLQKEYRQMLSGSMGSEQQAHAMGQMAIGSFFMATAANLALSGRITGSGPTDYELQKQLAATGWQPYSIVVEGENGEKTYFPIGRFDPVGMPFGMVADLVDMLVLNPGNRKAEEGIMAVGVALANSFSEKTFLMNLNQVIDALSNPGEGGQNISKYLGNLGGNLIPGSSAWRNYANQDPYMRDARTFLDRMMSGMPGYSETIPPQRDAFGDPIWRKRGLTTGDDVDLVESEHNRIINETGDGIRPPSPHQGGVDLRKVTLSDGRNAYDVYQRLVADPGSGPSLKDSLARLIESPGYERLVDGDPQLLGTKIGALMNVVSRYRQAGKAALLRAYPELRQQMAQSQVDVRSQLQGSSSNQTRPGLEELLTSLGY